MKKDKIFTIPNILTFTRILFIPFIVFFLFSDSQPALLIALILYILSAITDTLDGILARKLHQESALGAYLDPLADKILVNTLFVLFALKPDLHIGWWAFALLLFRDVFVTRLRNVAHNKNIHFKTSFLAKAKTSSQMLTVAYILIYMNVARWIDPLPTTSYADIWNRFGNLAFLSYTPCFLTLLVVIFTLASGLDYIHTYWKAPHSKNLKEADNEKMD